jgi:hypothetical protein
MLRHAILHTCLIIVLSTCSAQHGFCEAGNSNMLSTVAHSACDLYTLTCLHSAEHTAAAAAPLQQESHTNGTGTAVGNGASHPSTSSVTSVMTSSSLLPPGAIVLQHSSFHWGSGGEGGNVHSSNGGNGTVMPAASNCWGCCGGNSRRHGSAAVTAPPQGNILSIHLV